MEVCDAPPTVQCFSNSPYLRQPHDIRPSNQATGGCLDYSTYPYPTLVENRLTQPPYTMTHSHLAQPTVFSCRSTDCSSKLPNFPPDTARSEFPTHLPYELPSSGIYQSPAVTTTTTTTSVIKNYPISAHTPSFLNQLKFFNFPPYEDDKETSHWSETRGGTKNVPLIHNSAAPDSSLRRVNQSPSKLDTRVATTEMLLQHAQALSQWDVNDPKLPKIRQFDAFTMWPQGQCRYAYQKSASDGARRHASGWAMRNTNNHNAQILKKSCLGVLLCTSKRCSLAMRPAICDKARRRQEGRPCCVPNCTGRIYNQPCRGHGGYPVTHFWREHGDTVYFQAKGTHDHVKPDLKPVRDTAARRRRQMQLEKFQQNRVTRTHTDDFLSGPQKSGRSRELGKPLPVTRQQPGVGDITPTRVDLLSSASNAQQLAEFGADMNLIQATRWKSHNQQYGKNESHNYCSNEKNSSPSFDPQSFCPATKNVKAEPIFPSTLSLSSVSYEDPSTMNTRDTVAATVSDLSFYATPSNYLASAPGVNTIPQSMNPFYSFYPFAWSTGHTSYPRTTDPNSMYYRSLQNTDVQPPTELGGYPELKKDHISVEGSVNSKNLHSVGYQANYSSIGSLYPQSVLQPQQQQQQPVTQLSGGGTVGTSSESTSGGFNASWSTPSPPTGGSSSLFGSEFKTRQQSGTEDSISLNVDNKDTLDTVPGFSAMWRMDHYQGMIRQPELSSPLPSGYGLSTPTHSYENRFPSDLNSPDRLITTPSVLMSSSTPLSGNHTGQCTEAQFPQPSLYPGGYITPIPFYLSSSDSRSTRTDSSSASSNGRVNR